MNILQKISDDLKLDASYINEIVQTSFKRYKKYKIAKHNGGYRNIYQATPELKTLQYWCVNNIFNNMPISSASCAYSKGDSIKKHAGRHRTANHILHIDIKDFFESIRFDHLKPYLEENVAIFEKIGVDVNDMLYEYIDRICFRNDQLCIGTVSSPVISNIIMYKFDEEICRYINDTNLIYTRYADDMYVSSKLYISNDILDKIKKELKTCHFNINNHKTKYISNKTRMNVTGLIITNNHKVSIGRNNLNEIKKLIYNKLINKIGNSYEIIGYLSFIKDVDPQIYNKLIIKYSKYCTGDIFDALNM